MAQHPGLANPEISKIIGEQWREQAPEVKSDWKRLAEVREGAPSGQDIETNTGKKEEKQRHQRQYPGYRYQPRRGGKLTGIRPISASSTDDPVRCPKCNGRYISTPSTPLTPFKTAFGTATRNEHFASTFTPSRITEIEGPRHRGQLRSARMDIPRGAHPHQQGHRHLQYQHPQTIQTYRDRDEDMDLLSPSPDLKRRRFASEHQQGYAANSPLSYSAPLMSSQSGGPMSAGYRQQLPGPGMLVRPGTMGPPPQQAMISQQEGYQYSNRPSTFDESLRLPPLQTQMPSSAPISNHRPDARNESRESQARSVQAMVMTIPYVNKIKVLTKISPPLGPPGPESPAQETRGAVVAVEGGDKTLLADIGAFIIEHLSKDQSCAIKTWGTSTAHSKPATSATIADTDMVGAPTPTQSAAADNENRDPFIDYLSIISDWHKKSLEMSKYITTNPPSSSTDEVATSPKSKVTPIAFVPEGFSLTTSDEFALRIPINDSYAPVDHWQWMATLWRGIVGPDLTIYVSKVSRDDLTKHGGVEIRPDCAAIIVRVAEGGKLEEKTARRLGFEVVEAVRNVESGLGRN